MLPACLTDPTDALYQVYKFPAFIPIQPERPQNSLQITATVAQIVI